MIIVNADDFGRSHAETDVVLDCHRQGRITSASAMVFMADSDRAANCARDTSLDIGLHLNLSQPFNGQVTLTRLREYHDRVARFMTSHKFAILLYHPALRAAFRYVYDAQLEEFTRLYGRLPSHIDGHQHRHLCPNMLLAGIIPAGEKVRRSFSFWPGEKGILNRTYRSLIDRSLARRYRVTDFFFSLYECLQNDRIGRVFELSGGAVVELMTHPANPREYAYLMSEGYFAALNQVRAGTYASL